MSIFLKPAIKLLNRLTFGWKFSLIGLVLLVPILFICSQLFMQLNQNIQLVEQKRTGIEILQHAKTMLLHVQDHQGKAAQYLSGESSLQSETEAIEAAVDADIAILDEMNVKYGAVLGTNEMWDKIKRMWGPLKIENINEMMKVNYARYDPLFNDLIAFMGEIGEQYGLMLESDLETFYMMNASVQEMPLLAHSLGQARALGTAIAERKSISSTELTNMISLHESIESGFAAISDSLDGAVQLSENLSGELAEDFAAVTQTMTDYLALLQSEFVSAASIAYSHTDFFVQSTNVIEQVKAFYDKSFEQYQAMVDDQYSQLRISRLFVIALLLLVMLMMLYLCIAFYHSFMSAVNSLQSGAKLLATGDLTAHVRLETRDELFRVGNSFNEMASSFARMINLNRNLSEHLAASAEELKAITTESANMGANVAQSVQEIAKGAEVQSNSAEEIVRAVEKISADVRRIVENLSIVSEASADTKQQATQGKSAVLGAAEQMNQIYQSIEGLASVIHTLNEHSQKVKGIVNVIHDIANQTNLLSLNATIEAARAGQHGRGFAVVALEVKKLAEDTKQSTADIQTLISEMQRTVEEAVEAMNKSARDVHRGIDAIRSVEELFVRIMASVENFTEKTRDIRIASEQMSASTEQIKESIDQSVGIFHSVTASVQNISSITQEQLASMEDVASSAEALGEIVLQLQEEIGKFKL